MKKYLFKIFIVIPVSAFSIGGFGLNIPYSSFVVDQSSSDLKIDILGQMEKVGQIDRFGFENAYGFGGYLYLDIIPFIDIDVDINLIGNLYDFSFVNDAMELANQTPDTLTFAYVSGIHT